MAGVHRNKDWVEVRVCSETRHRKREVVKEFTDAFRDAMKLWLQESHRRPALEVDWTSAKSLGRTILNESSLLFWRSPCGRVTPGRWIIGLS